MSVFRCFTMYDLQREYFVLLIKRGFENNQSWLQQRIELEKKLLEHKSKPEQQLQLNCDYGNFLCLYEPHLKSYFILLSNENTKEEEQQTVLKQIMENLKQNNKLSKLTRKELDDQYKEPISIILAEAEHKYIEINGPQQMITTQQSNKKKKIRKDLDQEIARSQQRTEYVTQTIEKLIVKQQNDQVKKIKKQIKGFMMFDLIKQYFYLFINRDIDINKKWLDGRTALYNYIIEHQAKQEAEFQLKIETQVFQAKYRKEEKCYFILLVDQNFPIQDSQNIIDQIQLEVIQTKNFNKVHKEELEKLHLKQIEIILDKAESKVIKNLESNQIEIQNVNQKEQYLNPLIKSQSPQQHTSVVNSSNNQEIKQNYNEENIPLNQ